MDNQQIYLEKAAEVCRQIFEVEYFNGLGIPLPEITFIPPDSPHFNSGQYFIRIGDTWQIHLNFGKLPFNLLEFSEEVKVLVRHEVEHYKTCPFDVLTHFRMIHLILNRYNEYYANHKVDIEKLAPQLSNQISDVIIDTHNFQRYPEETLKSEISWIKKGTEVPFNQLPRHAKLMFLTKQALWKTDIELNESDSELNKTVSDLANIFESNGIIDKKSLPTKVHAYVDTFFQLFQKDKNEESSGNDDSQKTERPKQEEISSPQLMPAKDSHGEGGSLIFQPAGNIDFAIEQLASELSLSEFQQVLNIVGISNLTIKDKQRIWFDVHGVDEIPITSFQKDSSNDSYLYPETWNIGDSVEEIDLMLSYSISPKIIPGVTTKKWSKNSVFKGDYNKRHLDLLLILDSSGSMGSLTDEGSSLFQAVKSCYGIMRHFENKNSDIALINFSSKPTIFLWSKNYTAIKEGLLLEGGGNTIFPFDSLEIVRKAKKSNFVLVIITDGEIKNYIPTLEALKDHLITGNKLFMFLQDKKNNIRHFLDLRNYGGVISQAFTAEEIRQLVLGAIT